jgi:hypothetical protein
MYKAKIDIGGFRKGDIVPAEKALVWANMYLENPCEFVEEQVQVKKEEPINHDLNKDGKVDSTDGKIASQILNDIKKNKRK